MTAWRRPAAATGPALEARAGSGRVWIRYGARSGFLIDVAPAEFRQFVEACRNGEFDDLAVTP